MAGRGETRGRRESREGKRREERGDIRATWHCPIGQFKELFKIRNMPPNFLNFQFGPKFNFSLHFNPSKFSLLTPNFEKFLVNPK